MKSKRAVVLLSGGLDSTTTLYFAKNKGYRCFCLIFDYGQRHRKEINVAKRIAKIANCKWQIIKIKLPWKGSSLLDKNLKIPVRGLICNGRWTSRIPSTYVPGRNIIFLSFALSYAEAIDADAIFIGAHTLDYSGYPDCRPQFYQAFTKVVQTGTKRGIEGRSIKIIVPFIKKNKAQIIKLGTRLGAPLRLTWSCYQGGKAPCGKCDSCRYRAKGFREAKIEDLVR